MEAYCFIIMFISSAFEYLKVSQICVHLQNYEIVLYLINCHTCRLAKIFSVTDFKFTRGLLRTSSSDTYWSQSTITLYGPQ